MTLWKLLFGKLLYSFADDPGGGGGEPSGQPDPQDPGNDPGDSGDGSTTPTEISIGETKVTLDDLKKNEGLKQYFDAYDNREKWQAENTRKAQELKQALRDSETLRSLMADPRFKQTFSQPQQQGQSDGDKFVSQMQEQFPDIDPRVWKAQARFIDEIAARRVQETIEPIHLRQGEEMERQFLLRHPDVQKGSEEYQKIAGLVGRGVDADDAYDIVFPEKRIEAAIKKRDEENALKLKRHRTSGGTAGRKKPASSFDEEFENVWADHAESA